MSFMGANASRKARLEVEAVVIPGCTSCNKSPVINNRYAGIPSGEGYDRCPHCSAQLPPKENQGKIFDTYWEDGWFGPWKRKIYNFINTFNNPRRK